MTDTPTNEIETLRAKLKENPESLVFAPLADALRKSGALPEALDLCVKGLERHGHYNIARVVLGRVYQDMGKASEAEAEFKKVLDADPENFQALVHVGEICLSRKQHQAAIEEFQKALALNPDDEPTQELLKKAIETAAQEQSKPVASPAAPEKPAGVPTTPVKDSAATLTIAELYLKQGHHEKAIEVFQELLAEDPQNLMLRQKLSAAVEQQQKHQSATGGVASKIKKDEFTRPPDPVGDSIAEDVRDVKKVPPTTKARRNDDAKFTSEDILQVMLRSDKEDVVVEEKPKTPPSAPQKSAVVVERKPAPAPTPAAPAKSEAPPAPEIVPPSPAKTTEAPVSPAPKAESSATSLSPQQAESLKGVLAELSGVEGIRGSFLASESGALLVTLGKVGQDDHGLAQTAAAIFKSTHQSVQRLSQGRTNQVLITAETGQILLVGTDKGVLVVLADDKIKIGLLRLALDAAVKKVEKIFQG